MTLQILIVSERFYPEDFRVNELARYLSEQGHSVEVLTQVPSYPAGIVPMSWTNVQQVADWQGIRVNRVPTVTGYRTSLFRKLWNYFSFAVRGSLRARRLSNRPDVIFSFQTGPLTSVLPAIAARARTGAPFVIWTQDLWPETVYAYGFRETKLLSFALKKLNHFVYGRAAHVLVSCPGFSERLLPYVKEGTPFEFVPNWAQPSAEVREPVVLGSVGRLQFTFAGNIGKVQNLDRVLDAWKALPEAIASQSELNLIGDGSHLDSLKARVVQEQINGVRFLGRVPVEAIGAYYAASDVLVISLDDTPLFRLTIPSKFQTYLAAGRPILCVVDGEVRRIVEAENVGIVASPSQPVEIVDAVSKFFSMSAHERETMGERARRVQETMFEQRTLLRRIDDALIGAVARLEQGP